MVSRWEDIKHSSMSHWLCSSGLDATASVAAFASVVSGQGRRPRDPVEPVNY